MSKDRESQFMYFKINKVFRPAYDELMPRITEQQLYANINNDLTIISNCLNRYNKNADSEDSFVISSLSLEPLFNFAFQGVPFFAQEQVSSEYSMESNFLYALDAYLELIDLLRIDGESINTSNTAWLSCCVVINATFARMRLDLALLTEDDSDALCIHDIALLARMSDRSVRNCTAASNKHHLKTFKDENGITSILPSVAIEWLKQRRNFVPTQNIDNPTIKQEVIELFKSQ